VADSSAGNHRHSADSVPSFSQVAISDSGAGAVRWEAGRLVFVMKRVPVSLFARIAGAEKTGLLARPR